ncbi:hypothetical protein CCR75_004657 [Bremia lactucae]|uniref:Zinc finger Mcm10/DnaG-type domain-containing protein n=1 Tax=Bremia lactucae TaxID=4779 RepID=A0A976IGX7_BRELC|nr:hypothetical protein CCR75_004657 [Bremia lactucae]
MNQEDSVAALQKWNWSSLSQSNGKVVTRPIQGQRDATPSHAKSKEPLLQRDSTTSQLQPSNSKTISTKCIESSKTTSEAVEEFSKLRIINRLISAKALREEMEGRKFIQLHELDRVPKETFTNKKLDWVTIGVMTRKTLSKAAANGSTYMVWGLSNLEGVELSLFLFGDAYATHWREPLGSLVAILNATLLPATEKNTFAFKASLAPEIVQLGQAMDFGICKGKTSGETRCRVAINTAKTQYCLHHIALNFIKAGKDRPQLNNSAGNIRKTLFADLTKPKNVSAGGFVSTSILQSRASEWKASSFKKRKRTSAGASVLDGSIALPAFIERENEGDTALLSNKKELQVVSLMDQLRQPQLFNTATQHQTINTTTNGNRGFSSRAQKILSAVRSRDGKSFKSVKPKKINMMQFMNPAKK